MAKTYADLITEAREILQDTDTDSSMQRYNDTLLLNMLNRGLQELYRLRPDAFYDLWSDTAEDFVVPSLTITLITDTTSWLQNFGLPMMFYDPLVNWVIGSAEMIDDEFTDDSRSMQFLMRFKAAVTSL